MELSLIVMNNEKLPGYFLNNANVCIMLVVEYGGTIFV